MGNNERIQAVISQLEETSRAVSVSFSNRHSWGVLTVSHAIFVDLEVSGERQQTEVQAVRGLRPSVRPAGGQEV